MRMNMMTVILTTILCLLSYVYTSSLYCVPHRPAADQFDHLVWYMLHILLQSIVDDIKHKFVAIVSRKKQSSCILCLLL